MSYDNYNKTFARNKITCKSFLDAQHLFTPTAAQKHGLGRILEIDDGTGRMWRYCKDSGTGSAKALAQCAEPVDAQQLGNVQTAYGVSVGERKFDVLVATGSAISDHELVDGILWVNATGTAEGDYYIIKDNYWITGDTVMMVEIADEGGVRTAIAATDDISFIKNICRDTKLNPTTQDAIVVGIANVTVAAGYYYWAQYRGPCAVTVDASDTIVAGEPCGKAGTAGTAGAVGLVANDGTDAVWGTCICTITGGESAMVQLLLP